MEDSLNQKILALETWLKAKGRIGIAFSGGVDSSFLVSFAHKTLDEHNVFAYMARSPLVSKSESDEALEFCAKRNIVLRVFDFDAFSNPAIVRNDSDRCYHCKKALMYDLITVAAQDGIDVIADGSNVDDKNDYRPGSRALEECNIQSPLANAGFTKQDIRQASKALELETWNKPSMACLASRIPYGTAITNADLNIVDAAETHLRSMGFSQVRVRLPQKRTARIEIPADEIPRLAQSPTRDDALDYLVSLGFNSVSLDLKGYRTGSLNEQLNNSND